MTIERIEGVNDPRVIPIAAEGWNAIVQDGQAESTTILSWDQNAIIAHEEGKVIGVIVYKDQEWRKELHLVLGYVLPDYRRKGVYGALWGELVLIAQETKRPRIAGGTHVNNTSMQAVMEKLGREPVFISYYYDVPEKADEPTA